MITSTEIFFYVFLDTLLWRRLQQTPVTLMRVQIMDGWMRRKDTDLFKLKCNIHHGAQILNSVRRLFFEMSSSFWLWCHMCFLILLNLINILAAVSYVHIKLFLPHCFLSLSLSLRVTFLVQLSLRDTDLWSCSFHVHDWTRHKHSFSVSLSAK